MITKFLQYALLIPATVSAGKVEAQMIQDPTRWSYEVKKKSGKDYQLIFHLDLKQGWHIWSLRPGGDGYEVAPAFSFDKNAAITLKGGVAEKGKKTTTTMEGIKGKVNYLTGKIDYCQDVTVKATGTKVTGIHSYQVCNDQLCLPPKEKSFVFELK